MEAFEPFVSLGVAVAAGFLIGLEREQSSPTEPEGRQYFIGGARTHPLFALVGALAMLIGRQVGVVVPAVALGGVLAFLAVAYARDVRRGDFGLTSEAAFLTSFLLGALALSEGVIEPPAKKSIVVSAGAVTATLLLSSKPILHAFVRKISKDDVFGTVKFLIVAVVVLPLLPDQTFGPLDVLNPRKIGLMAVLIAGVSFIGYVAIRLLGPSRGLGVTGAAGGLVSSTAVTLSMSARAREEPTLAPSCAFAVVLASSIMFARVLAVVAVTNPALVRTLAVPMGAMGGAGLLGALVLYRRSQHGAKASAVQVTNPFELSSAIKFALLFAIVLLGSKALNQELGTGGSYLAGLLAGTTDVDAITLSMAQLARDRLDPTVAVTTIYLAALANTLVKGGMTIVLGGWRLGRLVAIAFGAMLAAGAAGLVAMSLSR